MAHDMALCLKATTDGFTSTSILNCDLAYFRVQKETTAPDRIRESSPTSLLAGRFPAYLRRSDGMRSFLESVAVDIV
jgi:hypothetical protein